MTPQEAGKRGHEGLVRNLGSKEALSKEMSRRGRLGGRPTREEQVNKELIAHGEDKEGLAALRMPCDIDL